MTLFAKRTKEILKEKNISQKELSIMSNVSEASLCRYLKGEISPRLDVVINVSKALGVSEDYLLGGDNIIETSPFIESRDIILRNRGQLTLEEKAKLIDLLFKNDKN